MTATLESELLRDLPTELRRVGFDESGIAGVMGGNMARVARAAWEN